MTPLWNTWPRVAAQLAAAERLVLFLDYDGTLTPLVDHPAHAKLPGPTRRLMRRLSARADVWVALVSGRAIRDLRSLVGLSRVCYVGNHGLEVQGPKLRYVNPMAEAARPLLAQIRRRLQETIRAVPGAWVEDKGLTLTLHLRRVSLTDAIILKQRFDDVIRPHHIKREVRVTTGKRVLEVRPPVRWTKGTIVRWLLTRWVAMGTGEGALPVYVGDDVTDEDAFEALKGRGVTIAVGLPAASTSARYGLRAPEEVQQFLQRLLLIRQARDLRAGRLLHA